MPTTGAAGRWRGDERPSGNAVTSRRPPPAISVRHAEARAKKPVTRQDSLTGSARAYAAHVRRRSPHSRRDEPATCLGASCAA
jgi:hypothetical protein